MFWLTIFGNGPNCHFMKISNCNILWNSVCVQQQSRLSTGLLLFMEKNLSLFLTGKTMTAVRFKHLRRIPSTSTFGFEIFGVFQYVAGWDACSVRLFKIELFFVFYWLPPLHSWWNRTILMQFDRASVSCKQVPCSSQKSLS